MKLNKICVIFLRLCDPKTAQLNNTKLNRQQTRLKQDISDTNLNLNDSNNNNSITTNNNNNTNTINITKTKKNPYKWLMEDFEDKNLDKVKRTLLVALDDISKGFSKSF